MPTGDLGLSGGNPGKGDSPRSCFSAQFRNNYDSIDWQRNPDLGFGRNFTKVYHHD